MGVFMSSMSIYTRNGALLRVRFENLMRKLATLSSKVSQIGANIKDTTQLLTSTDEQALQ